MAHKLVAMTFRLAIMMKKLTLWGPSFLLLMLPFLGQGQDKRMVDSLVTELGLVSEDSLKCRLMLELADLYKYSDTTLSKDFLEQSMVLGQRLENKGYLGRSYELLGKLYSHAGSYQKAIIAYDRALSFFNETRDMLAYYETLKNKGNVYLFMSDYAQAQSHYETALDYYLRKDIPQGASRCLNNLGIIHKNRGDYVEALSVYEESIRILEGVDDPMQVAQGYINMGNVFVLLGSYEEALDYYVQALAIAEEQGSEKDYALCLLNTGVVQNKCGHFNEANQLYQRSLGLARRLNDPIMISNCLLNIGTNYAELGRLEEALDYVKRGQAMKADLGDDRTLSNAYIHEADIHNLMQSHEKAIALYNQAIPIKEELGDKEGLARAYLGLAKVYYERGNLRISRLMADEALELSEEIGALEHVAAAYQVKEDVAALRGDYHSAYAFKLEQQKISDSILDAQTSRVVMEMEFRHRSRDLAKENENLKIQSALTTELMKKRNAFTIAIAGLAILLLVGLVLGVFLFRKLRNSSLKLEEKNLVITRQNMKLDTLNRTKDRMMSIIAHDLRGTIGNQLTAIEVLNRIESTGQKGIDKNSLLGNLKHSASYSLELLENLLHWSRLEENKSYFHPEQLNLSLVVRVCISLFDETARNKGIQVENHLEEDLPLQADRIMLETIIRNLLSNAIKFSDSGSTIHISAEDRKGSIRFCISDEGIGMDPGQLEKIMHNGGHTRRGTANEKGAGIGMTLIREFTSLHQGKLDIQTDGGKGTRIVIDFPKDRHE